MEDILELLRENAEEVPYPMELPSEEDLLDIQEELLIHIPFEMREFLLLASDIVLGHLEPVTASDPRSHTYLPEVASLAWELGLPRYLVPLCVAGDIYYAVEPEGEVVSWSVEQQDFLEESWESVWYWARDCWLATL